MSDVQFSANLKGAFGGKAESVQAAPREPSGPGCASTERAQVMNYAIDDAFGDFLAGGFQDEAQAERRAQELANERNAAVYLYIVGSGPCEYPPRIFAPIDPNGE